MSDVTVDKKTKEIGTLVEICHANLKNSRSAARYFIKERGLSVSEVKKYQLGFFPQNVDMLTKYVDRNVLQEVRVIDFFGASKFAETHNIIFPIFDEYNNPVGISGRTLLDNEQRSLLSLAKYEGSSFAKSRILYGLNHSRGHILRAQNCYVVEGNFDFMAMVRNGLPNTVAICGTAFSKDNLIKLSRYTDKITFILDRDDGGIKSMERIYSKYSNKGVKLRFMLIPEGYKDADEYFSHPGNNKETFLEDLETFIPNWS
jgi:DNA primase